MRYLVAALLAASPASAQTRTVGDIIAAEIGQCSVQRAALQVENESLKAKVEMLQKRLAPPAEQEKK